MTAQRILPLGGTLRDLLEYFPECERMTARELAVFAADAASLGLVTMSEYRRRIGPAVLSYVACLMAGAERERDRERTALVAARMVQQTGREHRGVASAAPAQGSTRP